MKRGRAGLFAGLVVVVFLSLCLRLGLLRAAAVASR